MKTQQKKTGFELLFELFESKNRQEVLKAGKIFNRFSDKNKDTFLMYAMKKVLPFERKNKVVQMLIGIVENGELIFPPSLVLK